jgi:hypothetical protein
MRNEKIKNVFSLIYLYKYLDTVFSLRALMNEFVRCRCGSFIPLNLGLLKKYFPTPQLVLFAPPGFERHEYSSYNWNKLLNF